LIELAALMKSLAHVQLELLVCQQHLPMLMPLQLAHRTWSLQQRLSLRQPFSQRLSLQRLSLQQPFSQQLF